MPQKIVKLEKTKLHQSYYNSKGNKVLGATTILSNLGWNRQVLMKWAVNQSIKGIDPFKFTGEAADIGTTAHFLCECYINNWEPDLTEVSEKDQIKARMAFSAFLQWEKEQIDLEYVKTEVQLASDKYDYGGTIDLIAKINNKLCLIDFKTSKYFYTEHFCQVAAYKELYEEKFPNEKIERCYILKINKETGEFEDKKLTQYKIDKGWEIFKLCLGLQDLKGCI